MSTRVINEMKSVQPRPFDEYSCSDTPPELELAEDGWSIKSYVKRRPPTRFSPAKPGRSSLRTAPEFFVWDNSLKLQDNSRYSTLPTKPGPNFSNVISTLDYYQDVSPGSSQNNKFFATFPPKKTQRPQPISKSMVS